MQTLKKESKTENNSTLTPTLKQFNHDELMGALYAMRLALESALIPFFLDRSTLYSIVNHKELQGSVSIGVKRSDLNEIALGIVYTQYVPKEITEHMLIFDINGVTVSIKIYDSKSSMIQNTDTVYYGYESWQIPNPYKKFWEERNEIT